MNAPAAIMSKALRGELHPPVKANPPKDTDPTYDRAIILLSLDGPVLKAARTLAGMDATTFGDVSTVRGQSLSGIERRLAPAAKLATLQKIDDALRKAGVYIVDANTICRAKPGSVPATAQPADDDGDDTSGATEPAPAAAPAAPVEAAKAGGKPRVRAKAGSAPATAAADPFDF